MSLRQFVPLTKPAEESHRKSAFKHHDDVDMTPMVDVTFLLLIFFMVTASFGFQKSIAMPPQQTDAPSPTIGLPEQASIRLQIDEAGSYFVMAADWELEAVGKQKLLVLLKQAVAGASDSAPLAIEVHESASLDALVGALDAGASAGFSQQTVTQVEKF